MIAYRGHRLKKFLGHPMLECNSTLRTTVFSQACNSKTEIILNSVTTQPCIHALSVKPVFTTATQTPTDRSG